MRRLGLALFLVAAACSPADTTESSTSSSAGPTTTTNPVVTTATPATTTTTTASTTTLPPITTTSLLAGNWADEPLVTTDFGALGWWDGSGWLDAATEGALPVVGGEDYQVVRLDFLGSTTAGPQTTRCEPLELIGVELEDPDLLGSFPGPYGLAVSAPWPMRPHLLEAFEDDGDYSGFASEILGSRGLDVDEPVIKQLFRTDLEGDGVNEVIVIAEDVTPGLILEDGDYSIAFLRKVVEGEVQTAILGETVVLDDDDQFGAAFLLGAVADLNGDGRMEVVMNEAYFEGFGVVVWEYVDDDLGPAIVLQTGCGS